MKESNSVNAIVKKIENGTTMLKDYQMYSELGDEYSELVSYLPNQLASKVKKMTKKSKDSVFCLYLNALVFVLSKYMNTDEIRLTLKLDSDSNNSFNQFVDQTLSYKKFLQNTFSLLKKSELSLENAAPIVLAKKEYFSAEYAQKNNLDLMFSICFDENSAVISNIIYKKSILSEQSIKNFSENIYRFLEEVILYKKEALNEIELITLEKQSFTGRRVEHSLLSLVGRFKKQAATFPEKEIIVEDGNSLTYMQLDIVSDNFAKVVKNSLENKGTIGFACSRSLNSIVILLSIIKLGIPFVPIDPKFPVEKIQKIIESNGIEHIVLERDNEDYFSEAQVNSIIFDRKDVNKTVNWEWCDYKEEDHFYTLYTSGSTGVSKGVEVQFGGYSNLLNWYIDCFNLCEKDVILINSPLSSDLTYKNIISGLITGAKLVITPDVIPNYELIIRQIKKYNISFIHCTPSAFLPILEIEKLSNFERIKSLRNVAFGGEALNAYSLREWTLNENCHADLYNLYGTTECTDVSTYFKIDKKKLLFYSRIPVGKPLDNVGIAILDNQNKIAVDNGIGEIVTFGKNLTVGYFDNMEATNKSFVFNEQLNERIYLTGDLGRRNNQGEIEFLERKDRQIKLNGLRVDSEEIENAFLSIEEVKECVVKYWKQQDYKGLVAYLVAKKEISEEEIRNKVSKKLSYQLMPDKIIFLQKMPLNRNQKINVNNLLMPEKYEVKDQLEEKYSANSTIQKLKSIWGEILDKNDVSIEKTFFEQGGTSLQAIQLVATVYKEFKKDLKIYTIYDIKSIVSLSQWIDSIPVNDSKEVEIQQNIELEDKHEGYPLSALQNQIYYLQMLNNDTTYNIPYAFRITGNLDIEKLYNTVRKIALSYEALRTEFFISKDNEVRQKINEECKLDWQVLENIEFVDTKELEQLIQPFNLLIDSVFRVRVIRENFKNYVIFFDFHHIIFDGKSAEIFFRELVEVYNGGVNYLPAFQLKDYCVWQKQFIHSSDFQKNKEYWLEQLKEGFIPFDFPNTKELSGEDSEGYVDLIFQLEGQLSIDISAFCKEHNLTPFLFFFSALHLFLLKLCNQSTGSIGTPALGRDYLKNEDTIGLFVNMLPISVNIDHECSIMKNLEQVTEKLKMGFTHQEFIFTELLQEIRHQREELVTENPLFNVLFSFEEQSETNLEAIAEVENVVQLSFPIVDKKGDLSVHLKKLPSGYEMNWSHNLSIISHKSLVLYVQKFNEFIKCIIENPHQLMRQTPLISVDELNRIKHVFNQPIDDSASKERLFDKFIKVVKRNKEKAALIFDTKELTYGELADKAHVYAQFLVKQGVLPQDVVGIEIRKKETAYYLMLALAEIGATCVYIDSALPEKRIAEIIKSSGAKFVVTDVRQEYVENIKNIVLPDTVVKDEFVKIPSNKNTVMYVLYTSGTTGKPKGIKIMEEGLLNIIQEPELTKLTFAKGVFMQSSSLAFDASLFEFWGGLINGNGIAVIEKEELLFPERLLNRIVSSNVKAAFITTSLFHQLIETEPAIFNNFDTLLTGGEHLSLEFLKETQKNFNMTIVNCYGPSETTIFTSFKVYGKTEPATKVTIGQPVSNMNVFIVDATMKVLPENMLGEIVIAGKGVSDGYLDAEETKRSFVENNSISTGVIYRTGDLGIWNSEGELEIVGRIDKQIKINGHRIEPFGIENVVLQHPEIQQAKIVYDKNGIGMNKLQLFYSSANELPKIAIRDYLKKHLAKNLIPGKIHHLFSLPLNQNGKIDVGKLSDLDPQNKMELLKEENRHSINELRLLKLLRKSLNRENILLEDNYFSIGGDSITLISIIYQIHEKMGVSLSVKEFMDAPTIQNIAELIENIAVSDEEWTNQEGIILYNTFDQNKRNLICIHDGTGSLAGYQLFFKHTSDDFNIIGLEFLAASQESKTAVKIDKLADEYLTLINRFDLLENESILVGWSSGGVIAHAIANKIELYKLKSKPDVFIFDSYFEDKNFNDVRIEKENCQNKKIEDQFFLAQKLYRAKRLEQTTVHYFQAYNNLLDTDSLQNLLSKKSYVYNLQGKHMDIFDNHNVIHNVTAFKKALLKNCSKTEGKNDYL